MLSANDHQIIPLLPAPPCYVEDPDSATAIAANRCRLSTGINLWQNQPPQQVSAWVPQTSYALAKATALPVLDSGGAAMASIFGSGGALSSIVTCQDCGNKAKKDCSYRRCRTCCKSRGFDCPTHVRSTWISAAQRRERHTSSSAAAAVVSGDGRGEPGSSISTTTKKPRLVSCNDQGAAAITTSTSNTTTPPRSFETSSSQQEGSFRDGLPGQVTAPAVFKCVRVTNMEDGEDEYAYQAAVRIGGHIYKGFLYDQGPAEDMPDAGNDGGVGGIPNFSELHLGGFGRGGGSADLYSAGISGGGNIMGGTAPF